MIYPPNTSIIVTAFVQDATTLRGVGGLAVTFDIWQGLTPVIAGGAATDEGDGNYHFSIPAQYAIANADLRYRWNVPDGADVAAYAGEGLVYVRDWVARIGVIETLVQDDVAKSAELSAAERAVLDAIAESAQADLTEISVHLATIAQRLTGVHITKCWALDPVTGTMVVHAGDTYGEHGYEPYSWALTGIDLTAATVRMTVGAWQADMTKALYAPGRWTVALALTAAQSTAMPEGTYFIRAFYPDGDRITLPVTGKVKKQ